ncbi:LPP20 family lipoprotein [bacterium]|nr:LPP20 family lipoprotein [bacterium]
MRKIFYLLILVITLMGCSSNSVVKSNGNPEWIDNPKVKYPEGMYLAAVGYGSTRRAAEADAMGSVARIFKTDVKANTKFTERYSELEVTKQEDEISLFSENTKDIFISAEQDLINIEIGESFTDNLGKVYALAYIHRSRTADIYDEKIIQTNEMVEFYLDKYKSSQDVLQQYAYLGVASIFAYQNQNLLDQLAIISPMEYQMIGVENNYPKINSLLREIANQISFSVQVNNDENEIIANSIKEIINEMNFNIVSSNPMLKIQSDLLYQDVELDRKEEFVKSEFNLSITDPNNQTILSLNEKARTGGINKAEAISKSKSAIVNSLKKKLQIRIEKYFDSLAK